MPRSGPRRRWRRRIKRALLAIALVLGLYEAAWLAFGDRILNEYLPPRLNAEPVRQLVTWTSARRLWFPGRVRVTGFRLRAQNAKVQWETRIGSGRVRVAMLPLLWDEFRIIGLDGEEGSIRLRFVPGGPGAEIGSPDAPPIEGFPDPPLLPAESVPPAPDRAARWTIAMKRCAIESVREVWIGSFRFTGLARARISMDLLPGRWITARRFELDVSSGQVAVGEDSFVTGITGDLSCHVDRFDMEDRPALDVFEEMSARASLRGRMTDVQLPRARFPKVPWLGFGGSKGNGELDVVLEDGAFAPGTRLRLSAEDFEVAYPGSVVRGRALVQGHVVGAAGANEGRVEAKFDAFAMRREGAPSAHVRGDGFAARLVTQDLTLRHPLETYRVELDLPESEIVDFSAYDDAIPRPLRVHVESGVGTIQGRLTVTEEGGSGSVHLDSRDLVLEYEGERLRGDFVLDTAIRAVDMKEGRFDLSGTTAHVKNGLSEDASPRTQGWWADTTFETLDLRRNEPATARMSATARLRDSRPLIALMAAEKPAIKLIRPALVATDVKATCRMVAGPDLLAMDELALDGKGLFVRACADLRTDSRRGVIYVDTGMLSAGIRFADGRRSFKPFAGRGWYEAHAGLCEDPSAWGGR